MNGWRNTRLSCISIHSSLAASACAAAIVAPSGTAFAQESLGEETASARDTLVVTARRREESLQDVPVSFSAFDDNRIQELQADTIAGIQNAVPNLYIDQGDASNAVIYIRGVGQNDSLSFADPGVGVYVDDVFVARSQAAFLDLFDVERVEVLRGSKTKVGGVSRVSAPRIEREIINALTGAKIALPGSSEAKLLRIIDKIILHPVEIEIRLNKENNDCDLIRVAADLRSTKNGIRIIEEHGANQRSESLVKAIALAHDWRQQMERGSFQTIKALADAKGLSDSYVWKILRLSYLAPDIVEAILDGRQPSHLSLHQINAAKLSGDWASQRRALGFPALT